MTLLTLSIAFNATKFNIWGLRMKPEFVWTTSGDWVATRIGNYIFDSTKAWVAWLDGSDVYTKDGEWIGTYSRDNRVLRPRAVARKPLRTDLPPEPVKPDLPG